MARYNTAGDLRTFRVGVLACNFSSKFDYSIKWDCQMLKRRGQVDTIQLHKWEKIKKKNMKEFRRRQKNGLSFFCLFRTVRKHEI